MCSLCSERKWRVCVACYCGGMVNKVVLSLMYWSNAPVTPDPIRRGSSSDSLTQGMADDVLVAVR